MKTFLQLFFFLMVTQICFAQWYQQNSGTETICVVSSFIDSNTGSVVGDGGTILRTTNGGVDWTLQQSETMNNLYGISFTDSNFGSPLVNMPQDTRTSNGGKPTCNSTINRNYAVVI